MITLVTIRCWRAMRTSLSTGRHFSTINFRKKLFGLYEKVDLGIKIPRIHGPTAEEVTEGIDLKGKTALVTGANSGLGLEMSRVLAARGGRVLMASRNTYAAAAAARRVADCGPPPVVLQINLASLKSVRECSEIIIKSGEKLDIVILNAAVFGLPWSVTEDSLETTFQVNFLSQYYLLTSLEAALAHDARVVFVSSESHRNVEWSVREQLAPHEGLLSLPAARYTSIKAYNTSKLCALLAAHHLGYCWARTARAVCAAHPGSFVKTGLSRNWWMYDLMYTAMQPFSKTIAQAGATPLRVATQAARPRAAYWRSGRPAAPSPLAQDALLAFRLQPLWADLLLARAPPPPHHDPAHAPALPHPHPTAASSLVSNC